MSITSEQIQEDVKEIKSYAGEDTVITVEEGYYLCKFTEKGVEWKFLVSFSDNKKPFALQVVTYDKELTLKAIDTLRGAK